jgi:hypothetical protein
MTNRGLGQRFVEILLREVGTENRLVVSNIPEMSRVQKAGLTLVALLFIGLFLHELRHFYRYDHFVPFGLHADVSITTSDDVIGVEGIAKIYDARLTNYGVVPNRIVVCDYRIAGAHTTAVNYVASSDGTANQENGDSFQNGTFTVTVCFVVPCSKRRRSIWLDGDCGRVRAFK